MRHCHYIFGNKNKHSYKQAKLLHSHLRKTRTQMDNDSFARSLAKSSAVNGKQSASQPLTMATVFSGISGFGSVVGLVGIIFFVFGIVLLSVNLRTGEPAIKAYPNGTIIDCVCPEGPSGRDGQVGQSGPTGATGPAGQDGSQGFPGPSGPMGMCLNTNPSCTQGPSGATGPS